MAVSTVDPNSRLIHRVALRTLVAGIVIMGLKFGVFRLTNSAAVLSDALESIINIVAAAFMYYSIWLSSRPADKDHPYGHGKIEFMCMGLEGWLILAAGAAIVWVAVKRLIHPQMPGHLDWGTWLLLGVNLLNGALAGYVLWSGRKYRSQVLTADGKHLLTDVASTFGVVLALVLVHATKMPRLDPILALAVAAIIFWTSWRILWQSIDGLMDRTDPKDEAAICAILDDEIRRGGTPGVRGYHKVRHRRSGTFYWVDMHLQVEPTLTVAQSHALASRIEYRIEQMFGGRAKATAHVEPYEPSATGPPVPR